AELAVLYLRINVMPVVGQELVITDPVRGVDYFYRLGMSRAPRRDLAISWIGNFSPHVSPNGRKDPGHSVEIGFGAPEATAREGCHRLICRLTRGLRGRPTGNGERKD